MNSVEYISKGINISLKNEKDEAFSKNVELANASIVDTMSDESIPLEKWVNKTRSNAYHSKKSLYKESLSAGPNQVFLVNNQSIPFIKAEITWQKRSSESNIDISADDLIYGIVEDIESGDWHIAY